MKIALIGDYSKDVTAHRAIPVALQMEAEARGRDLSWDWLHTGNLDAGVLAGYDAGWAVPASPYASFDNALAAIHHLREADKPFLGTCGGYQHALVEFARNVLGETRARITEIDPDCPVPVVSALTCALIDQADPVLPVAGGLIDRLTGGGVLQETYRCSFGINPDFAHLFDGTDMIPEAHDPDGLIRAMRLTGQRFFLGTAAFQPERAALQGRRHPIVSGFVEATWALAGS